MEIWMIKIASVVWQKDKVDQSFRLDILTTIKSSWIEKHRWPEKNYVYIVAEEDVCTRFSSLHLTFSFPQLMQSIRFQSLVCSIHTAAVPDVIYICMLVRESWFGLILQLQHFSIKNVSYFEKCVLISLIVWFHKSLNLTISYSYYRYLLLRKIY